MRKTVVIYNKDNDLVYFQYVILKDNEYRAAYDEFKTGNRERADISLFISGVEKQGIIKQKPISIELINLVVV